MRIVFFGTPNFAAYILEYLIDHTFDIVAVVTQPPRPKKRSSRPILSPVAQIADQNNLPLYQPQKATDPAFIEALQVLKPDLFVVVAYGKILRSMLLAIPNKGCVNIHASLLPKYRGAAPMQWALIKGEAETGITIMMMVEEMDAGDILLQKSIAIAPSTDLISLETDLCSLSKNAIVETVQLIANNQEIRTAQDHSLATFAPKIQTEDCEIIWNSNAEQLHNIIRGVRGRPGAWCTVQIKGRQQRLKVDRSEVVTTTAAAAPADILQYDANGLVVACGKNALRLLVVQPEGKRVMSAAEMVRGIPRDQIVFATSSSETT